MEVALRASVSDDAPAPPASAAGGLSAWPSDQVARLVERQGEDPQLKRVGKKIRKFDLDGAWLASKEGSAAECVQLLEKVTKEKIADAVKRSLVSLFEKLRTDPRAVARVEAVDRKAVDEASGGGGGARGIRTGVVKQKTMFRGSLVNYFSVRVAVVMTSNDYKDSDKFGNLKAAVNDGRAIEKMCIETLGFAPENVIFVENAKKADFQRAFEKAAEKIDAAHNARGDAGGATPRAQFVFFYAGHGFLDAAGRGWLAPCGFRSDDPSGTGIAMSQCVVAHAPFSSSRLPVFEYHAIT